MESTTNTVTILDNNISELGGEFSLINEEPTGQVKPTFA